MALESVHCFFEICHVQNMLKFNALGRGPAPRSYTVLGFSSATAQDLQRVINRLSCTFLGLLSDQTSRWIDQPLDVWHSSRFIPSVVIEVELQRDRVQPGCTNTRQQQRRQQPWLQAWADSRMEVNVSLSCYDLDTL